MRKYYAICDLPSLKVPLWVPAELTSLLLLLCMQQNSLQVTTDLRHPSLSFQLRASFICMQKALF